GVVIDDDIARAPEQEKRVSAAPPPLRIDVAQDVVANLDVASQLAGRAVIGAENLDAGSRVTQDVARERHLLDLTPGTAAALIAHREEHRETRLRGFPVVLERVAVDHDPPGVLQFEEVLDLPARSAPGRRLRDQVAPDGDIRRDQTRDGRVGATEKNVLA